MRIHQAIWIGLMMVATGVVAKGMLISDGAPIKPSDVKLVVIAGLAEVLGLLVAAVGLLMSGHEEREPTVRAASVIAAGLALVGAVIASR